MLYLSGWTENGFMVLCPLAWPHRPWMHVSVRNLATLVWMRLTTLVLVSLTTHPQASFPPWVAPEQLPSPRALPIGVVTWSADLLPAPNLAQGTCTPYNHAHDGRTPSDAADSR